MVEGEILMGKVFVHVPLKRAELKRLTAPPPPPPEPVRLRLPETDIEEKARRAAERAAARAEQERKLVKFREEVEMAKSIFKTVWIESYDFCTWMKERFNQDSELCDRITSEEVESLLVDMFTVLDSKCCLYCGERAMKHAGDGWAGLMTSISPKGRVGRVTEGNEAFTYLLCNRCGKLSHKAIRHRAAETLVRKVRLGDETRAIRKSEFTPFDIQYFGDRFDVLIARDREQTIGFFGQLKESDMLMNPELLDEFA